MMNTTLPVSPMVPANPGPAAKAGVVQIDLNAVTGQVVTGGEFGLATTMGPNYSYSSFADPSFQVVVNQYSTDLLRHNWELNTFMDILFPSRAAASTPDFSHIDTYLAQQSKLKGFFNNQTGTQIVTLGFPSWLNILNPVDQALYADMVKGIAQHFIAAGEPVQNYELVNEPDGRYSATDMANTFNVVAQALKSIDPVYRLGGLTETYANSSDLKTFFQIAGANIGFVSWYQYVTGDSSGKSSQQDVTDSMGVANTAQSVRSQMQAAGIPDDVPLFLGEYNVDGGNYNDPNNTNMVGAVAAAATTYGMIHSNTNMTMGAAWSVQNDAYGVFGSQGAYHANPVGVVLADLTAYMPGYLVQTTMPSDTPGLGGYTTKSGQGFATALIDTSLSQSYTVDLSKDDLPTTGLYRVEVSNASPQGIKTALTDLSNVSVAAGSLVIVTNEAPHSGTELNGTTTSEQTITPTPSRTPSPTPSPTPTTPPPAGSPPGVSTSPAVVRTASGDTTVGSGSSGTTTPSSTMPPAAGTSLGDSTTSPGGTTTTPVTGATPGGVGASGVMPTPTGQFSVASGQIIDPSGTPFVARGIIVFLNQVDPATILKTFPGINAVRLATTPGADPNAIDAMVQGLTSKGVVVLIEDHSSSGGNPNTSSGQPLTDEANWYAGLAGKYQNNPFVWFGTANEPDNTGNLAAISAQEATIYNAVRGAGSNAMVLMEMRGGFTNDAAQQSASTYANMKNVAWDTHYYGWVTNQSTDPATIAKGLQDQIANAQSVKSADGTMPVVIGEYGPSTSGIAGNDANGLQVVQAIHDSGKSTFAWAYNAGTDTLTNGNGLTDFGQLVAKHIAASASTPSPAPAPTIPTATGTAPGGTTPPPVAATTPGDNNGGSGTGGTVTPPTVGTGSDTVVLKLSEDAYQGDAQFTFSVDGEVVGPAQSVTALHSQGQSETFTFKSDWAVGAHRFGVTFTNDRWDGTDATDRNLYIDGATFDGGQVQNATELMTSSTVTFGTAPISKPPSQPEGPGQALPTPSYPGLGGPGVPPRVGNGADTVTVNLSEDADGGDAQFTFTVDGMQLGPAQSVNALHGIGPSEAFTFRGDWGTGPHQFGVTFANAPADGFATPNRHLYLDSAAFDANLVANATQVNSTAPVTFGTAAIAGPPGQPIGLSQPAPNQGNTGTGKGGTTTPPAVGTGADTLVLVMSETASQGDAQFTVTVDGKAVGSAQRVTAPHGQGQQEGFTYKGDWGTGAHKVGITFDNPDGGRPGGPARHLYLDSASLDGKDVQGATEVGSSKPVSFTITALLQPPVSNSLSPASLGTMMVTGNGGASGTVSLIGSGSYTDHPTSTGTVSQGVSNGTDTVKMAGTVKGEAVTLGSGTQKMILVNPRAMVLTGGSGADTVSADNGANTYVASTGSLTVAGGSDASSYVLRAASGQMTINDFNPGKGDTLTVDKSLQGALKQASDGHGGTLLTFGAGQGSVDLIHHASVNQSDLRFI